MKLSTCDELYETLLSLPQTGSRAYGCAKGDADDDRYVSWDQYEGITQALRDLDVNVRKSDYSEYSVYFELKGRTFNVFQVSYGKCAAIWLTTEILKLIGRTPFNSMLYDKSIRCLLFESLCAIIVHTGHVDNAVYQGLHNLAVEPVSTKPVEEPEEEDPDADLPF